MSVLTYRISPKADWPFPARAFFNAIRDAAFVDTIRALPRPVLEGFTKAFRKRFQVPLEAPSIADRICQQQHHDWIETFLVQHQSTMKPEMVAQAV
jgi:hypothetical protein